MEKYNTLKNLVSEMESDVVKFEAGNSSAGTRVRGFLQDIKKLAQEFREEVQDIKNEKKKGE